jgi:glycosyltransferase involved in cell wall biosynthesis
MDPVTLIGSYPPPYGGVSVHIKRLKSFLERQGIEVTVLADPGSGHDGRRVIARRLGLSWYLQQALPGRRGLLHFHTSGLESARLQALSLLARRGRKVIVTLHSLRDPGDGRDRTIAVSALRSCARTICVGPAIQERLLELGVPEHRIRVIPPYLPPERTDEVRRAIEPEVDRFLSSRRPVLTASAYRLTFHDNQDVYGLDLCIDLCRELLPDHPQLGFVFALPAIGDEGYYAAMQERIAASGIGGHFCFARSATEYWPIIERSTILVRPTSTDSYGVSVMEAIDLGVPAIASDVCLRAPGAILFHNRKFDSLLETCRRVLGSIIEYREALAGYRSGGSGEEILSLYREVLQRAPRRGVGS